MQFLKDLPQTTQLSIALVLVLLPVLAAIVLNRKKSAAATPADAASRKERRRRGARTTPQRQPRRSRRNLADETAQQLSGQLGADTDVDLIITPEDIEAPEGITLTSAPVPAPDVTRDPHNALVSDEHPADDDHDDELVIAEMIEPEDVPVAVVDDPYVTVAPPLPVGASVAQPGWPSPGELASGFDPDAFDPLPPAAPAPHAEVDMHLADLDSGEAWLDENLTATQTVSVPDEARDSADTQIIQVPAVDWDDDDDFDPATGWSDDGSDMTPQALAIDEDEQPDWVVPTSDVDEPDDAPDDELPLEPPPTDASDEAITVTVSADDDADEITDWDEDETPLTTVAWDAPDTDDTFDDEPTPTDDEPIAAVEAAWTDDDEGDDEAWADAGWSDDPQEIAMATPLAVPFPPPGTLPAHEQMATLAVPFPVPGTLPSHEETAVQVFTERGREPRSEFTVNGTRPQMPAITGRIDGGAATPVVIDLAKLVANGERVEMVIEQDASGHGVRLRFGPSDAPTPAPADCDADATAPAMTEAADEQAQPQSSENAEMTPVAEVAPAADAAQAIPAEHSDPAPAAEVPADVVAIAESAAPSTPTAIGSVDIPFLTGGPRSSTHQGADETGEAPVSQPTDAADEVVATDTVTAPDDAAVGEVLAPEPIPIPDVTHDAAVGEVLAPEPIAVPAITEPAPVAEITAPDTARFDDVVDAAKVADALASYQDESNRLYDAEPEPTKPVPVGVSSLSDDDPGKILADIRARLAALDGRRTENDFEM